MVGYSDENRFICCDKNLKNLLFAKEISNDLRVSVYVNVSSVFFIIMCNIIVYHVVYNKTFSICDVF